jgi:SPP1 gp7 family putative phage head morphogenesis protein
MRGRLSEVTTPEELERVLHDWVDAHHDDQMISGVIYGPSLMADMAGQLMIDVYTTKRIELSRSGTGNVHLFKSVDTPAFLDMQWTEAIDLYKELEAKGLIPRNKEFANKFATLIKQYSDRGKDQRVLFLERMRKRSYDAIIKALEEGTTFREYTADINALANTLGVGEQNPAYLETVFRTNIMTSYGAGRERAMKEAAEDLPYWEYRTVEDSLVRPAHRLLNGKVFKHGNPITDALMPPNDYNCRCGAVPVDALEKGDLRVSTRPPKGFEFGKGFDRSPSQALGESIL